MVRGEMGLKNVEIMIPFVRTLDMAKDVNEVLEPRYFRWINHGQGGNREQRVLLGIFSVGFGVGGDNGDTKGMEVGRSLFEWR